MIVHPPSKSVLLKVRPQTLASLQSIFPNHHKLVNHEGHNIALPHNLQTTKILQNMGIKVPGPIRYHYDWPRPARFDKVFEHQYVTADFCTRYNRLFVLNEMGTSKTASVLWAADYMMRLGLIRRVLIASPLSTLEQVWQNEIFDVCMHRSSVILHGSAEKRRERLSYDVDFYIINHSGIKVISRELIERKDIDLIIVDEASIYRNAQTDQYKILEKVARNKKLWLLTGAPCPNAPTDAWALARLVDPSRVPPYFSQFKKLTMNQVTTYKWVPKPGSHKLAYDAMQPAVRFKKSDCLSLPPVTYTNRSCTMSQEQQTAYDQMKTHLIADAKTHQITAVNAADKISKLRQILCGSIKDATTGQYIHYNHDPRLKVLQEVIEQSASKVLVIVPFKGILQALKDDLNAWHATKGDGRRVELVNGDVSVKDRNRIFQDFRDDPDLTELVCHPKVMSHGLTLTQADTVVFYAPINSNDESMQVMDRINRPGQTRKMTIVRIVCNALESGIYAVVEGRKVNQQSILDLYKQALGL